MKQLDGGFFLSMQEGNFTRRQRNKFLGFPEELPPFQELDVKRKQAAASKRNVNAKQIRGNKFEEKI